MLYTFVKLTSRLVCLTPQWLRRLTGDALGNLVWLLVPAKRKTMAFSNIQCSLAVDEATAWEIARNSSTRFGKMFMEVLFFPRIDKHNIRQLVRMEGQEHLAEALSYGKGAVLATSHSGNWELLGAALAMYDFPIVAVVQKQTNAAMDRFINEYRTMAGMHVTYKTGVRDMIRLLNQGMIVGLLMDQNQHRSGVIVDFFNRPASTPQGAAALARMNDAPIVPAFITENADGTHTAIIHPIVWAEKGTDRESDVVNTTQVLTKIIEMHIRQHPAEWFWLHNRWKNQPPVDMSTSEK